MTVVVAHRGASGHAPENTMESFRMGVEMGADAIELDDAPSHLASIGIVIWYRLFETRCSTDGYDQFATRRQRRGR